MPVIQGELRAKGVRVPWYVRRVLHRLAALALVSLAAAGCDLPPDSPAAYACVVCAQADECCKAHTANPKSNCQLHATCLAATGQARVSVADGCGYYLRVASTPPAPAACGPHPDGELTVSCRIYCDFLARQNRANNSSPPDPSGPARAST
jgi:hypothetical protein